MAIWFCCLKWQFVVRINTGKKKTISVIFSPLLWSYFWLWDNWNHSFSLLSPLKENWESVRNTAHNKNRLKEKLLSVFCLSNFSSANIQTSHNCLVLHLQYSKELLWCMIIIAVIQSVPLLPLPSISLLSLSGHMAKIWAHGPSWVAVLLYVAVF